MLGKISHRGPDDHGIYLQKGISLAHSRLSIIDLTERGRQPIHNEDDSLQIIFNGEIYNFEILRNRLEELGHRFYTDTDTEVIVHLYEEYGVDCVKHLNGMFAFALWDSNKRELFLARDRIGIKPLYYYLNDGVLIFASEIKAILEYPLQREVDIESLNLYFNLSFVPSPRTMFKDIKKLPQGHTLLLRDGNIEITRYWDITNFEDVNASEGAILKKMNELFERSVQLRLVSERPIGIFLSGGVDSSAILSYFSKYHEGEIKTFSVGFDVEVEREKYNEDLKIARKTSECFDTDHRELLLSDEDMLENYEDVIWHLDEPISNSTQLAVFFLARNAKKEVSVVLSGEGGDELFGGYHDYLINNYISTYQILPKAIREKVISPITRIMPGRIQHMNKTLNLPENEERILAFHSDDQDEINKIVRGEHQRVHLSAEYINSTLMNGLEDVPFNKRLFYFDLKSRLVDNFLTSADKMTMASALEDRVPVLDHNIVEFSFRIPSHLKTKGNTSKYLLKKLIASDVPKEVVKGKRAFLMPTSKWLRTKMKRMAQYYLTDPELSKHGFFDTHRIAKILDNHITMKKYNLSLISALLTFQIWYKQFIIEGSTSQSMP